MRALRLSWTLVFGLILAAGLIAEPRQRPAQSTPAAPPDARLDALKQEAAAEADRMTDFTQQMVDMIFSFGELGFQEIETSKYITDILRRNGFTIDEGIAGIPTAWMASWGSGSPVIALGTDIDCIPQASQKPGVAYHDPMIPGAPGHGEGHNSGQAVNVTAALVLKKIMEREKIPGTIKLWPGVAEEQLGTKAYYVRDGYFRGVDVVLYNHVGSSLGTGWGEGGGNGLVSIEYLFDGESAHSAGSPWRGRSALDAVELMNIAWNFRREHLRLQQRSHYVITNGGDQPNVVPPTASVWYYFRETNYDTIVSLRTIGDTMAEAAAMMTGTTVASRVLGTAWPSHMNRPLAETMFSNIQRVGLPEWSDADQTLAKALQRELGVPERGLTTEPPKELRGRESMPDEEKRGGGSDDIGDISWTVPTVSLSFPSNIAAGPGHNWANAVAMATPIAHKGATAGAKVQAMTVLDILRRPQIVKDAKNYFETVQNKERRYQSLLSDTDKPAIWLNKRIMDQYRPEMRKYYYDPTKYKTYLEQLGIQYPTVRRTTTSQGEARR